MVSLITISLRGVKNDTIHTTMHGCQSSCVAANAGHADKVMSSVDCGLEVDPRAAVTLGLVLALVLTLVLAWLTALRIAALMDALAGCLWVLLGHFGSHGSGTN